MHNKEEIEELLSALRAKEASSKSQEWRETAAREIDRLSRNEQEFRAIIEKIEAKVSENTVWREAVVTRQKTVQEFKNSAFAWLKVLVSAGGIVGLLEGAKAWVKSKQ